MPHRGIQRERRETETYKREERDNYVGPDKRQVRRYCAVYVVLNALNARLAGLHHLLISLLRIERETETKMFCTTSTIYTYYLIFRQTSLRSLFGTTPHYMFSSYSASPK
jgi:hypothetical protein